MIKPEKIVKMRHKLGLSQVKAAKAVDDEFTDCTVEALRKWEQGKRPIPRWYLYFLKILFDRG